MKLLLSVLSLASLFSADAFAWKETGGGDELGLEFQRAFASALQRIENREVALEVDLAKLKRASSRAKVISADQPLLVSIGDEVQDSVAINEPATGLVRVQRARWKAISDPRVQEAIALHEMLSLAKLEATGIYTYSAAFLKQLGLSPWLVSQRSEGKVEKPVAKDLTCEISYSPSGVGRFENEVVEKIGPVRLQEKGDGALLLHAKQNRTTKDGRFLIEIWATQPYRTALVQNAYSNIGIAINDRKKELSVQRGSSFGGGFAENITDAELFYNFDNSDPERSGDLNVSCELR